MAEIDAMPRVPRKYPDPGFLLFFMIRWISHAKSLGRTTPRYRAQRIPSTSPRIRKPPSVQLLVLHGTDCDMSRHHAIYQSRSDIDQDNWYGHLHALTKWKGDEIIISWIRVFLDWFNLRLHCSTHDFAN